METSAQVSGYERDRNPGTSLYDYNIIFYTIVIKGFWPIGIRVLIPL